MFSVPIRKCFEVLIKYLFWQLNYPHSGIFCLRLQKLNKAKKCQDHRDEKRGKLILLHPIDKNYFSLVYVHMEPVFALFLSEKKVVFCLF